MKLPESFVKEGLTLSKNATLYGIKIEQLSHDELLAACMMGWKSYQDQLMYSADRGYIKKKININNT